VRDPKLAGVETFGARSRPLSASPESIENPTDRCAMKNAQPEKMCDKPFATTAIPL
jgi:hypothetical protein